MLFPRSKGGIIYFCNKNNKNPIVKELLKNVLFSVFLKIVQIAVRSLLARDGSFNLGSISEVHMFPENATHFERGVGGQSDFRIEKCEIIINCIVLLNIHIHADNLHTQLSAVHIACQGAVSQ